MQRRYITVDVFTDRAFGGNPLAVVLDAQGLSTERMQAIAVEFNYAETTFVLTPKDPAHTAHVRIFTPKAEMPFAGHPNVGTAFVLGRQGECHGRPIDGNTLTANPTQTDGGATNEAEGGTAGSADGRITWRITCM